MSEDQGSCKEVEPGLAQGCQPGIKELCLLKRDVIEVLKKDVLDLKSHDFFFAKSQTLAQHGEMKANIMLAYRHLEDARMRLGKVVQANDGGKSVYPK